MNTTTAVLLGLLLGSVLGAVLGAIATWSLLRARERDRQADANRLLESASQRYERDTARRDAAEQSRLSDLERTLAPISSSLSQLEKAVARGEQARIAADGSLRQHIQMLSESTERLATDATQLTAALRAPTSRGQWGEVQLQRIVEASGMLEHVDFDQQLRSRRADGSGAQIPDLVVHLAGDRHVAVDAKAPMDAYLDALSSLDPAEIQRLHSAHAKAVRGHVDRLAGKNYWAGLGDSPEFVVLFVPADGVLAAALETDPGLLDHAFAKNVVIASPATLMALLRTVAHTWRAESLNQDAREVLELGRELHERLATVVGHLAKTGRSLDAAVSAFNQTVGSLQSRVMVSARKFEELSLVATPIPDVEVITQRARLSETEQ